MATRILVTGTGIMAPRFGPLHPTMDALLKGESAIQPLPPSFGLMDTRIGGFVLDELLENLLKDPALTRISRRALRPSKLALVASLLALQNSGLLGEDHKIHAWLRPHIAACIGTGVGASEAIADVGTVLFRLQQATTEQERKAIRKETDRTHIATGMNALPDAPVCQVSQAFGVKGMIACLIKACATGAGNIQFGAILIEGGYANIVLTGGTESLVPNDIYPFNVFARDGALSKRNEEPEGASRPFDKDNDGFVPSEGAGVLVLEEESHAQQRQVQPLAQLIGWGETSDAQGATDPDPGSQAKAMRKALDKAGMAPEQVDVFVAHGTSTKSGDKSELEAFQGVFGLRERPIIVAPKDRLGHTLGASGAIQAALAIEMMLRGQVIPALNLKNPIPEARGLNIATAPNKVEPFHTVMCNAAGFGGQNVCLVFRKWQG